MFPSIGRIFEPYILLWLGLLLFFNLIQLNTDDLLFTFTRTKVLLVLTLFKLVIMPTIIFLVGYYLEYSKFSNDIVLSMFLLSGISTGLGPPFVTNFVGSKLPIVVGLIITSSLAVPFILTTLVYVLFKSQFSIPLGNMVILLLGALFIPLVLSNIIRKYHPKLINKIGNKSLIFSISLIF